MVNFGSRKTVLLRGWQQGDVDRLLAVTTPPMAVRGVRTDRPPDAGRRAGRLPGAQQRATVENWSVVGLFGDERK
uniref:DNA repair protein RecO n=1 Tax=Angiostrongylus cantonensis TaxID=6313 RepID=A0A0K0DLT0_ANGCA